MASYISCTSIRKFIDELKGAGASDTFVLSQLYLVVSGVRDARLHDACGILLSDIAGSKDVKKNPRQLQAAMEQAGLRASQPIPPEGLSVREYKQASDESLYARAVAGDIAAAFELERRKYEASKRARATRKSRKNPFWLR